jgi:hypothetical protein
MLEPVVFLLQEVGRVSLNMAAEELLALLAYPGTEQALRFRAAVLMAVIRDQPEDSPRLAAQCFYDVYAGLLAAKPEVQHLPWPGRWNWDRCKGLRHWLLDTWAEKHWPAAEFVRCLGHDRELARRVFKRASKHKYATQEFLRRLDGHVKQESELYKVWKEFR